MLQYLVVLLDNISLPYCHADNPCKDSFLMPIDTLKKAILFGMKNNLMIQYVMPPYDLSSEYYDVIESIDNVKIGIDVSVFNVIPQNVSTKKVVLRINISDFIEDINFIIPLIKNVERLSICYRDIEVFNDEMIPGYINALEVLANKLINEYSIGNQPKINILTDILEADKMNNCGAGITNITVCPNGSFYLCPAFYYNEILGVDNEMDYKEKKCNYAIGNIDKGVYIPNRHLLDLKHAPLCRTCDAYHCNRCIWLNRKLTGDSNTPSHQQCVISHIERNASRNLSIELQKLGMNYRYLKEVSYIDPFDNVFPY